MPALPSSPLAVRVADAGTTGGTFETGWTLAVAGGVLFGEGTGGKAGPADFVVAGATLFRPLRPGLKESPAAAYLRGLLAGTQTTPVDVEVRTLGSDDEPTGRGIIFRIAVPTAYSVGSFDASSKEALVETFEFVARDFEVVRS